MAISGYKSLYFLDKIIKNTDNLGLANKESIVSAGHIFKSKKYFKLTNIFPLDSEHFSLFDFFNKSNKHILYSKIILTASGGPFLNKNILLLKILLLQRQLNTQNGKWVIKTALTQLHW